MANIPELLEVAYAAAAKVDEVILRAKVNDNGESRVGATLFLSISEQFAATLDLIAGGRSSQAPILVRSMLEGMANLVCLAMDPAYLDQIRYEDVRSNSILFTEYMAVPDMDTDAIQTLQEWSDQAVPLRKEFEAKGFRVQDAIGKFKQAGITDNYVAYRVFCSFAHNQLTTLIARHAGHFELKYRAEATPELTKGILSVAISILCRSMMNLPKFINQTQGDLNVIADEIDARWTAVTCEAPAACQQA